MSTQRIGKYACLELERRYLLHELPAAVEGQEAAWLITDRYITGTQLRLRRMVAIPGGATVFKLGQKYRAPGQGWGETTMTNLYLGEHEYDRLSQLDAQELVKRRHRVTLEGRDYSIDVFEGKLAGLILAETECETVQAFQELQTPSFAWKDVTADPFFTGGNLAALTREAFESAWESAVRP
jgi:CYTH domain-containing protein